MNTNIFIIMGVAAVGKTTLGKALAEATGGTFFDGDDFHSPSNREKMTAGIALTDEDRKDWLTALAGLIGARSKSDQPTFIACSALKQCYRDLLRVGYPELQFIFLTADPEILRDRITQRYESGGHFMPPSLLDSQLATLEPHPGALALDTAKPTEELVAQFLAHFPVS